MPLKTKPSTRINKRYLLLEADAKEKVEKAILDYLGILGFAKASPNFVRIKTKAKSKLADKLILSINRKENERVRAAFALAGIKILRVSGTLKGLAK